MARFTSTITAVALLAIFAIAQAQVPIPTRPDGHAYGEKNMNAPVQLEVYIDLLCPDSRDAYPALKQVAEHYTSKNVNLLFHIFPLPFHHNAFDAAQALLVVQQNNTVSFEDWTQTMFDNQEQFGGSVTMDKSETDVINMYADFAVKLGMDRTTFLDGMKNGELNEDTRVSWKYGCTRGVAGTPIFFINGVTVEATPTWTLKDYQTVIDPLLAASGISVPSSVAAAEPSVTENIINIVESFLDVADGDCPASEPKCVYLPGKFECCKAGENCIPNVGCRC
eukprot:GFYU01004525.1.p1 GENE.GFYU01004525.1~~GFYU01004525.1.p1  ORF type:complete len:280 (-),score=103.13 GFYU01004525.1:179-1018(-)